MSVTADAPLLHIADEVADEVLAPHAEQVDIAPLVPRSHLDVLAESGLFGLVGPLDAGGLDADSATMRRTLATIAGGCGATFFVWAQHHGVVGAVRRVLAADAIDGSGRSRSELASLLERLCRGEVIAGTAFAYLRNAGAVGVSARPDGAGWRLDGIAPWVTSWGVADTFLVAGATDDDRIVWAMLDIGPAHVTEGLDAIELPLSAFTSTGTVSLRFSGVRVASSDVVMTESLSAWRRTNRVQASPGQPQSLGVASRCARLLRGIGDGDAVAAAERIDAALSARWADDDHLLAGVAEAVVAEHERPGSSDAFVVAASEHRTRCLELGRAASTMLLAAVGGRGMALTHPAQRLVRESAFYVIQAMTDDGRHAVLDLADALIDTERHHRSGA